MTVPSRPATSSREPAELVARVRSGDGRPKPLLWWALVLLGAFFIAGAVIAVNVESPFPQGLDDWWRPLVGQAPDSTFYLTVLPMLFQYIGETQGAVLTLLVIPGLLAAVGRWRSALFFLSSILLGPLLISQLVKNVVHRPRPAVDETAALYSPLFITDHGSFPSGHAVTIGALVFAIGALIPATRIVWRRIWWGVAAILMLGMMWQRTLINAHWISDTFFGVIAGAGATLLVWWAFWPWLQRDYGRPVWFLRSKTPSVPA